MKKFAAFAGAGAILLASAGLIFAFGGPDIEVSNFGTVDQFTKSEAKADSGDNTYVAGKTHAKIIQSGDIKTGDSMALAGSTAIANQFTTVVKSKNCFCSKLDIEVKNVGWVKDQDTLSEAKADSGDNKFVAGKNGGKKIVQSGDIKTGDTYAESGSAAWANIFSTKVVKNGITFSMPI